MHSFSELDWLQVEPRTPTPGSIVFTARFLLLRSYGIVSDRIIAGKPCVISGSPRTGRIFEQTWESFSRGKPVSVRPYPSALPDTELLRQARSLIGSRYDSLTWHGKHIAGFAHDIECKPPLLGILSMALLTVLDAIKTL